MARSYIYGRHGLMRSVALSAAHATRLQQPLQRRYITMGYATVNPYTNKVVKEFKTNTEQEVQEALNLSHKAFLKWSETPVEERVKPLAKAAELLRKKKDYFASLMTLEMGKLKAEAEVEVELCAGILEFYLKNSAKFLADDKVPVADPKRQGEVKLVYQPLGVIITVQPWNFPFYQPLRAFAPVAAGGNTLILKHASNVPQSAQAVEELLLEAGFPKGVFINLRPSYDQVDKLLEDPRVKGVTLTGSERGGTHVAEVAGRNIKKVTLELGGSDPFVVLDDVDIEKVAKWAVTARHWNAGQVCVNSKRFVVVDSVYDKFLAAFRTEVNKLVPGDPTDPKTTLAPLAQQSAADEMKEQIKKAVKAGASIEEAAFEVPSQGAFLKPVILENLQPDNEARQQEFFGPVSLFLRAKDEAEAIQIANETGYGLGASVWSQDEERAYRAALKIEAGMVSVNHPVTPYADTPFGGVKRSGVGRELGELGLKEFVNIKIVNRNSVDAAFF